MFTLDFLKKLDQAAWSRPAFGVLAAIAVLLKTACPPYTIAGKAADFFLTNVAPVIAVGSFGAGQKKE